VPEFRPVVTNESTSATGVETLPGDADRGECFANRFLSLFDDEAFSAFRLRDFRGFSGRISLLRSSDPAHISVSYVESSNE
jgi:hypothetical protein